MRGELSKIALGYEMSQVLLSEPLLCRDANAKVLHDFQTELSLTNGDTCVLPVEKARNVGAIFDSNMNLEAHVNNICCVLILSHPESRPNSLLLVTS